MNNKVRAERLTLSAGNAIILTYRLNIVVALFVNVMGNLKNIFGTDIHAYFAAFAKLFINIYSHFTNPILSL